MCGTECPTLPSPACVRGDLTLFDMHFAGPEMVVDLVLPFCFPFLFCHWNGFQIPNSQLVNNQFVRISLGGVVSFLHGEGVPLCYSFPHGSSVSLEGPGALQLDFPTTALISAVLLQKVAAS